MKKFYFLTLALICAFVANAYTAYLSPSDASWSKGDEKYAVWAWADNASGSWYDMTFAEAGLYKAEIPDNKTNLIFVRMDKTKATDWGSKYDQTEDLKYDGTNNLYTITSNSNGKGYGSWSVYTPVEKKSFTVYLLKSSTSWTNVNIYAWYNKDTQLVGAWPGVAMSEKTVDGYDYFYYTIELAYNITSVNVIFNNGSEQTVDLTCETKDTYFELGGKDGDGKYSANSSDTPTAIEEVGVDAGAAVYYNLQGVKVANPENGIFIKKQGNKTIKVVL